MRIPVSLISGSALRRMQCLAIVFAVMLSGGLPGCGKTQSKKFEPMRYNSLDKLKERLKQVSEFGDGGSSLGGIPESIDELMKGNPEKGKAMREAFLRLDTATEKEVRKKIAKEMVNMLE